LCFYEHSLAVGRFQGAAGRGYAAQPWAALALMGIQPKTVSHSSNVAREYGIPAVMATGVATRRIHGEVI